LAQIGEAEFLARRFDDRALQVRAMYRAAYARWWFEDAGDAAVEQLRQGLALAEQLDDSALRIEGHTGLQVLLYNLGDLAGAEDQLVRCSELVREAASLRDEARVTFQLGIVKYHRGDIDEAERLGLAAYEWLERTGDSFYQVQNLR